MLLKGAVKSTHIYYGGSGTGVLLHPAARKASPPAKKTPVPERPTIYVCGVEFRCAPELFFN